ncbi:toxin-antitoxin system, toxin component [Streptomyces sp. NPDC058762]|uniref:toxin-antitoxin system, toxin component n=1 Tax=Streptomyces sp. NPDC058762 TaxID=3346629 RepID=UPI0036951146
MKRLKPRTIAKAQKRLMADLGSAVTQIVNVPTDPHTIFKALCQAMSDLRNDGRSITLKIQRFPEGMATHTGLWLDFATHDVIVIEEDLPPDHQLVVLGHELWHMHAGHCGHDIGGGAAAAARAALDDHVDWSDLARVAARSHSHQEDEVAAEGFGLLLGSRMNAWLAEPGAAPLDDVARRIGDALGYRGSQV